MSISLPQPESDGSARLETEPLPLPRAAGVLARLSRSPVAIAHDWYGEADRIMRERTATDWREASARAETLRRCARDLLAAMETEAGR